MGRGGRRWRRRRVGRVAIVGAYFQTPTVEVASGVARIGVARFGDKVIADEQGPGAVAGFTIETCKTIAAGAEGATIVGELWRDQPFDCAIIERQTAIAAATPGVEAIIIKLEEIDLCAIRRGQAKRKIPQSTMLKDDLLDADMGHGAIHRHIDD